MTRLASSLRTVLAGTGFLLVALTAIDCNSRSPSSNAAPVPEPLQNAPSAPSAAGAPTTVPPTTNAIPPLPANARTEDEKNTIAVFKATAASAVFVTQRQLVGDWDGQQAEVPAGTGTGFIWDTDGHVVTNFHVVQDARSLLVTLDDHRSFEAKVVGVEPRKDIAVIKIDAPKNSLHPILLPEKSYPLEVGQKVVAIGNPFGLDHTLTTGIISALGRQVQGIGGVSIRDMVQTDAAINPGNSGGPLIDSAGRLIGMNTMIFSSSKSSAGIGFAVPVTSIARVVPQIIRTGHAEQIGLGIQIDQRLEQMARVRGAIVFRVLPNSPAEKAGFRGVSIDRSGITLGDIVTAIDGERIEGYDDLYNTLDKHRAGDQVEVTLMRDGKTSKVKIGLVAL